MEQTVYGDLLFFVNFCMDFQCLFLTARLLHRPFSIRRGIVACTIGALYACAALFTAASGALAFALDLAVCMLMCIITFFEKKRAIWRLLIPFGLYFGVSAAVGGVMSGMASLLLKLDLSYVESGTSVSSPVFFALAALGGAATFAWARLCQRRANGKRGRLTLTMEGKTITVQGLVDTANLLCDPVSGRPVAVLDCVTANGWFPALFPRGATPDASVLAKLPTDLARHARLIPAETVTGKGLMLAMLPDSALLDTGEGAHAVELLVSAAPLASVPEDCAALLPAAIVLE